MNAYKNFRTSFFTSLVAILVLACENDDHVRLYRLPHVDGLNSVEPQFKQSVVEQLQKSSDAKRVERKEQVDTLARDVGLLASESAKVDKERTKLVEAAQVAAAEKAEKQEMLQKLKSVKADLFTDANGVKKSFSETEAAITVIEKQILAVRKKQDDLGFWERIFSNKRHLLRTELTRVHKELNSLKKSLPAQKELVALGISPERTADQRAVQEQAVKVQEEIAQININISALNKKIEQIDQTQSNIQNTLAKKEESISGLQALDSKQISPVELELQKMKLKIINQYQNGENINAQDVVDAILLKQFLASGQESTSYEKLKNIIVSVASKLTSTDPGSLKTNYESILSQDVQQGKKLIYNRDASTVWDVIVSDKVQCYSGTLLYLTFNEFQKKPHDHLVVIFTDGHVQPGYVALNGRNEMNLYGIETTADGKGKIDFGPTSQIAGDIRIFDAEQFLLVELLKDEITSFETLYPAMLKTIEPYGFVTTAFKPLGSTLDALLADELLYSSPLGFGRSKMAQGDLERVTFEEKVQTLY